MNSLPKSDSTEANAFARTCGNPSIKLNLELQNAININKFKNVKSLIELGANVNYEYESHDVDPLPLSTPLLNACEKGNPKIVKILLDNNADVKKRNNWEMTPLHFSCINGFLHITQLLIEAGAKINDIDYYGASAISYACENGHTDIVKFLIQNEADIYNKKNFSELDGDEDYLEPIFFACRYGYLDIAKCLLNEGKCDPNLKGDYTNITPLHVACQFGQFEIVKELIIKGASINERENEGFTPLHEVCAYTCYDANEDDLLKITKFLVKNNALINESTSERNFIISDNELTKEITHEGSTPLDFAIENGYDKIADYLKREIIWKRRRSLFLARPYDDHETNKKHKPNPLGEIITATKSEDLNSEDVITYQLKLKISKFL